MDDDDLKRLPEPYTRLGADVLEGERPYMGTYTPPAPYRVFRLIHGGGSPEGATTWVHPDGFVCLTIRPRSSPRLRVVDEANSILTDDTPQF
jgi:hypothetical protein